jgi:hypothetical protein
MTGLLFTLVLLVVLLYLYPKFVEKFQQSSGVLVPASADAVQTAAAPRDEPASEPLASEPAASEPVASEPVASEPAASDAAVSSNNAADTAVGNNMEAAAAVDPVTGESEEAEAAAVEDKSVSVSGCISLSYILYFISLLMLIHCRYRYQLLVRTIK